MGTIQRAMQPFDLVRDARLSKRWARGRKGKECRTDIVEEAPAMSALPNRVLRPGIAGLQHQDVPAVPGQLNTRDEAVGPRANDDGIDHAIFQPKG